MLIPVHTKARGGIFAEKVPRRITEKKNGVKNTRYIKAIEIQIKAVDSLISFSPVERKNASAIIPAPNKNRTILKNTDCFPVIYSPLT